MRSLCCISVSLSSIGNFSISSQSTITTLQSIQSVGSASTITMDTPPPLPPRVKKHPILRAGGEPPLSPIHQHPDAPHLPPRDSQAPPLPPRRNDLVDRQTLPRNVGLTGRPPSGPGPGASSSTLPRRNPDRDSLPANINGERGGSVTPELPPKTYRAAHSRKQSS